MGSSFSWPTQVASKLKAKLHFKVKFKANGKIIVSTGSSVPLVIVTVDNNLFG